MGARAAITGLAVASATALAAGVLRPDLPVVGPLGARLLGLAGAPDGGDGIRTYYQFVDPQGVVRFVESLDDVPEAQRATAGRVELAAPPPTSPAEARVAAERIAARAAAAKGGAAQALGPVTIYVTSWCPHCKSALADLDRRGIPYVKKDIEEDPAARAELREKTGGTAVPMLEVGGRAHRGYSADAYARIFDAAG